MMQSMALEKPEKKLLTLLGCIHTSAAKTLISHLVHKLYYSPFIYFFFCLPFIVYSFSFNTRSIAASLILHSAVSIQW